VRLSGRVHPRFTLDRCRGRPGDRTHPLGRCAARCFAPPAAIEWIDRLVREGTWLGGLALRCVPAIPFSLLNFLLGVTTLSWRTFLTTPTAGSIAARRWLARTRRPAREVAACAPPEVTKAEDKGGR
jgi:hypothetical protein